MATAGPRPLIGLTSYRQPTSWWSWHRDAALVPGTYLDMVEAAGGQPLLVPPTRTGRDGPDRSLRPHRVPPPDGGLDRLIASLDGLVLTGGGDLEADRYGQPADPRADGANPDRDQLELDLVQGALAADLPVLAVCRGMQVLNVALGGDLVQHLAEPAGSVHRVRPGAFGPVRLVIEPSSEIGRLFGEEATVLCSHHQAVASLGHGLRATARSADGVIEAVELPGHRFVIGVQWHPEEEGDTRLFEALVAAATSSTAPAALSGRATP